MKIILAPNAFKESLDAPAVARAMARGWRRAFPNDELIQIPVADGGDGTARAFASATCAKLISTRVTGPLGGKVRAHWAWDAGNHLAVIEMAQAAGLWQVPLARRNPMKTTTRGVGELILAALKRGAKRVIVGLGGSATVDGGAGLAQALGWQLLDNNGRSIVSGGEGLLSLARIVPPTNHPARGIEFICATDVSNPLLGKDGAAKVFGPQKGATAKDVIALEKGLANLDLCLMRDLGKSVAKMKGAGAAGGMGAAMAAFLNARAVSGIETFLEHVHFQQQAKGAQLVLTGEGRLDRQTLFGKAPAGVAKAATALGIPVIALAGSLGEGWQTLLKKDFLAAFSIVDGPMDLEEAQKRAAELIADRTTTIARVSRLALRADN